MRTIRRLLGDERVRFVLVGGVNTVVGYGLFVLFELTIGHTIGYLGSLYASYLLAIISAFVLHRRFTFRVEGNLFIDFLRFSSVYLVAILINTLALPILVEFGRLTPIVAQACIVVLTTVISYVGHKWFSFRRAPAEPAEPAPSVDERNG